MRNIIHPSLLTSATPEGRRSTRVPRVRRENQRRRGTTLAALGSRVVSPAQNVRKRRALSEGCPSPGSVRRIVPPKLDGTGARRLEQDWLDQHRAEFAGAWVALEGARLVAHGSSARQVLEAAKSEGYEQPLVVHIPSESPLPFGGW